MRQCWLWNLCSPRGDEQDDQVRRFGRDLLQSLEILFEEALLLNPDNTQAKKILEALRARKEP